MSTIKENPLTLTEPWPVSPKIIKKTASENIRKSHANLTLDTTEHDIEADLPVDTTMLSEAVDGLSTRFGKLAVTADKIPYAFGAMARVFFLKDISTGKRYVVKVERILKSKDEKHYQYPWKHFQLNSKHSSLEDLPGSLDSAYQRQTIHTDVANKLESCSVRTARFYGGMIIPGRDTEQTKPLYAELWEDPGGVEMGENEKKLELLYHNTESNSLQTLVKGLRQLSEQGYVYDIGNHYQTTPIIEYPYVKNIFLTPSNELVAIDFNLGFDLIKEKVISPSALSNLWVKADNGYILYNEKTVEELKRYLKIQHKLEEKTILNISQLSKVENDAVSKVYSDWEAVLYRQMREEKELERYITQIQSTSAIYNKLFDIHKKSFWDEQL